jgi:hypothetical protein
VEAGDQVAVQEVFMEVVAEVLQLPEQLEQVVLGL